MDEVVGKAALRSRGINGPLAAMIVNSLVYYGIIPTGEYEAAVLVVSSIIGGIVGVVGRWKADKKITSVL